MAQSFVSQDDPFKATGPDRIWLTPERKVSEGGRRTGTDWSTWTNVNFAFISRSDCRFRPLHYLRFFVISVVNSQN